MKLISLIVTCVMLLSAGNATAKDETRATLKPWAGSSNFEYTIDSSALNANLGSPTSKLDFKDMESYGVKFEYLHIRKNRYNMFSISIGTSSSDGTIVDEDWYSDDFANKLGGPTLFSQTISDASVQKSAEIELSSGYIFKGNLKFNNEYRVGGHFSYLNEAFEARGIEILSDPYNSYNDFDGSGYAGARTLKLNTKAYSLGVDFGMRLVTDEGFFADMSLRLIPLSFVNSDDYHYLRNDLNLPSIELTSFNYGGKAEIELGYKFDDISISIGAEFQALKPYNTGSAEFKFKDIDNLKADTINHNYSNMKYNISLTRYF